MFCQSATLLLGHVGPAVCVCLFLRSTERMKTATQCLFGCRRCRAEHPNPCTNTKMHADNSRHRQTTPEPNHVHMWKHNLGSSSSRKLACGASVCVIATVYVCLGRGSLLPLPSCWSGDVYQSRLGCPRSTRLAFLLSSW